MTDDEKANLLQNRREYSLIVVHSTILKLYGLAETVEKYESYLKDTFISSGELKIYLGALRAIFDAEKIGFESLSDEITRIINEVTDSLEP